MLLAGLDSRTGSYGSLVTAAAVQLGENTAGIWHTNAGENDPISTGGSGHEGKHKLREYRTGMIVGQSSRCSLSQITNSLGPGMVIGLSREPGSAVSIAAMAEQGTY